MGSRTFRATHTRSGRSFAYTRWSRGESPANTRLRRAGRAPGARPRAGSGGPPPGLELRGRTPLRGGVGPSGLHRGVRVADGVLASADRDASSLREALFAPL